MDYFVYIIQSLENESLYIGHTNNLEDRLRRNRQGRSKCTKSSRPWEPLHSEEFETRSEAANREIELKALHRKALLLEMIRPAYPLFSPGLRVMRQWVGRIELNGRSPDAPSPSLAYSSGSSFFSSAPSEAASGLSSFTQVP
jgi:putative endonuclease